MIQNKISLLSSEARIQVPWVKVTLRGKTEDFTFGVFTSDTYAKYNLKGSTSYKDTFKIKYPNYVQALDITKINGQVNKYSLKIVYPVTQQDDPNFFEKIFSNLGATRKIIFSYGDAATPSFIYKNEEAVITTISQSLSLSSSSISYTINAISGAALNTQESLGFEARKAKPSMVIKEVFNIYNLKQVFTGMSNKNWSKLVAGHDAEVQLAAKTNISALDYIIYLVSCMRPVNNFSKINPKSIFVLTIHDNSSYDASYTYNENFGGLHTDLDGEEVTVSGPYFKVSEVNYNLEKGDAYSIDIGYNTSAIVTSFSISNDEEYALYYEHQMELAKDEYVRRINDNGQWEDIYSPTVSSKNTTFLTKPEDRTWWTKITQFPINATITIQGLLRPAQLLTYVRLNVIFPGGHRHNSSGLYIITEQRDSIDAQGYKTTLSLTRIGGADLLAETNTGSASISGGGTSTNTSKS